MTLNTEANREVIYHILSLLPTIEEALQHILVQVDELRLEESSVIFQEAAEAIAVIFSLLPPLLPDSGDNALTLTTNLREAISQVIDAYEAENLSIIRWAVNYQMIPNFNKWKQELELSMTPSVLS